MPFRPALIATVVVGAAAGAPAVRADDGAAAGPPAAPAPAPAPVPAGDPRDAFGLPRHAAAAPAGCGDGLGFGCAVATDPLDAATPYALATWLPASYLRRLPVGD
ncbi:MAG TPA: hypothetical protein VK601_09305, partial [Kofleriaceae bacterium]|nr:hypothetical protein [Kofleriaceae bacterium]